MDEIEDVFDDLVFDDFVGEEEEEEEFEDEIEGNFEVNDLEMEGEVDWDSEEWEEEELVGEKEGDVEELDGFLFVSVGYGNVIEEILRDKKKKRFIKAERKRLVKEVKKES